MQKIQKIFCSSDLPGIIPNIGILTQEYLRVLATVLFLIANPEKRLPVRWWGASEVVEGACT